MTPAILPDDLRDAINRAARAAHARYQANADHARGEPPPPIPDIDGFEEDITDHLAVPLAELVGERDRLEAAIVEAIRLESAGMNALAWDRLRANVSA